VSVDNKHNQNYLGERAFMAQRKNLRFDDLDAFLPKNSTDFTIRKAGITSKQVIAFLTMTLLVIAGVSWIISDDNGEVFAAITLVSGIVLCVAASNLERVKKKLHKAEFLNAMFSSALSNGYDFSIIVRRDDARIVYFDYKSQQTFPSIVSQESRNLESLLTKYGVEKNIIEDISAKLVANVAVAFDLALKDADKNQNFALSCNIDLIARPSGFALIRGKKN